MRRRYGLELTLVCGCTNCGWSSERPMHCPELPPVHGTPSIEGRPPGEVLPNSGELGTRSGLQEPVKVSSDSPVGHAAEAGPAGASRANAARAGAAKTAAAKPPARISRRAGKAKVAMGFTLSVICWPAASCRSGSGSDVDPEARIR